VQLLVDAVEDAGFGVKESTPLLANRRFTLSVPGMACSRCTEWVATALQSVEGVNSVSVSLEEGTAEVDSCSGAAPLLRAAQSTGFEARLLLGSSAPVVSEAQPEASALQLGQTNSRKLSTPATEPATGASLLRVWNLSCAACASSVERAVMRLPGVQSVSVSLLANTAMVTWKHGEAGSASAVADAIRAAGYPCDAVDDTAKRVVRLMVSGMCCKACPRRIREALKRLPGIGDVRVFEQLCRVEVHYDAQCASPRLVWDALTRLGYGVALAPDDNKSDAMVDEEQHYWRRLFLSALVFTAPLVILTMLLPYSPTAYQLIQQELLPMRLSSRGQSLPLSSLIAFLLATPVQVVCGSRFASGALCSLRSGSANMDVLVAMGTYTAFAYSSFVLLLRALRPGGAMMGGRDMFDTPAMLITFIVLGKWLEARAKGQTTTSLRSLANLQPPTAMLLDRVDEDITGDDGFGGRVCPASMLRIGDLIRVEAGERIPADALILSGALALDESLLTGESTPVARRAGASGAIVAGSSCVSGHAIARCTAVGKDTGLARIVALVRDAQASKAPIQAAADRVSAVFVPAVFTVACASFACWYGAARSGALPQSWTASEGDFLFAFMFAISSLVVACPCALGLATPSAVMVASGLGASHGILLKGGAPLQAAASVDTVCFDKTGTLTQGAPSVEVFEMLNPGGDMRAAALLAAALEGDSMHPVAKAVVRHARREYSVELPSVVTHQVAVLGCGVAGVIGDRAASLGSPAWFAASGGSLKNVHKARVYELEQLGCTVLLLAQGTASAALPQEAAAAGGAIAIVALLDSVKPDAAAAVQALHNAGIRCVMLTGDNPRAAATVAKRVGITDVRAGLLPADKVEALRSLRLSGRKVAMVGDGVNDAPALAAADVGVAIGAGSDVAIDAAGVVLVHSRVCDVVAMLELAQAAMRRIRLNLFFSLVFNGLGVPIAAGVLYPAMRIRLPPEVAAAAMAASSVSVVGSSLLLKRFKSRHFA